MTTLYEPVCHGSEHAPFNAALLATVLEAFPGEAVSFCAEASHLAAVRWILSDAGATVTWRPIMIAPRVCENVRARFGYEWRTVGQALDEVRRTRSARLIACASTAIGLAALKCQTALGRARPSVVVIHHSALSALIGSRSTRALFTYGNGTRLRHVVLGHNIRRTVTQRHPGLERCVFGMRHPYLFPASAPSAWPDNGGIRFGFLGLASRDKGFDVFCRLAARARRQCGSDPRYRFELVGRLAGEFSKAPPEGVSEVDIADHGTPLPKDQYNQRVRALTYAVLPYAPQHYALTSSGAVLDAFLHVKPCIVLRNPLFEEYFAEMGDIGYLCDSEDEMLEVARQILAAPPTVRYAEQCRNILRGREMFAPAQVARELRFIVPQAH